MNNELGLEALGWVNKYTAIATWERVRPNQKTNNEEQGLKISRSSISSINDLLKLLWRKDIVIKDIKETQGDLEKSLLDVLASTK